MLNIKFLIILLIAINLNSLNVKAQNSVPVLVEETRQRIIKDNLYNLINKQLFYIDEIGISGEPETRQIELNQTQLLVHLDSVFPNPEDEVRFFKILDSENASEIGLVLWQYAKNLNLTKAYQMPPLSDKQETEIFEDIMSSNLKSYSIDQLKHGLSVGASTSDGTEKATATAQSLVHLPVFPQGDFSVGCSNFITSSGRYGPWGAYAYELLKTAKYKKMLSSAFVGSSCPRFSRFSDHQKRDFLAYTLAAMSHGESSCNPYIREQQGPNGILSGLFQLHKHRTQNYAYCPRIETRNPSQSVMCVTEMFRYYADRGMHLFDPRSYWDVLRTQSGPGLRTKGLVSRYPGCT